MRVIDASSSEKSCVLTKWIKGHISSTVRSQTSEKGDRCLTVVLPYTFFEQNTCDVSATVFSKLEEYYSKREEGVVLTSDQERCPK